MTTLYRLIGANQELIYVGITDNYGARIRAHAEKAWFEEVRAITTEEFETRIEAKSAETRAITSENPKYNKAEKPRTGVHYVSRPLPPRNPISRTMISISDAADYAGVSKDTIRRRISDGTIRAVKFGPRLIRIDKADLEVAFEMLPTAAPQDWN